MQTSGCVKMVLGAIVCFVLGALFGAYLSHGPVHLSDAKCLDGAAPDENGCCAGEIYTDMGDMGWNCCPENTMLDCFPPIGS